MPSAAANDVRVRTPVSLPAELQKSDSGPSKQQSSHTTTTTSAATTQRRQSSSNGSRPALNRNVASHTSVASGGTDGSAYVQSDDGSGGVPEFGDTIDSTTFEQILEMDDDEDEREFSKSIVYDFFEQAAATFQKMDKALQVPPLSPSLSPSQPNPHLHTLPHEYHTNKLLPFSESRDLKQLSELGHFLKGSSATLGLTKVKDSCEKIQHFGAKKDATGERDVDSEDQCLRSLKEEIKITKREFAVVEGQLKRFYRDEGS